MAALPCAADELASRHMLHRDALLALLFIVNHAAACATSTQGRASDVEVRDGGGEPVWRGPASFTVRAARSGAVERAIGLRGFGEIHVGVAGDPAACRLVWSKAGLDDLVVYAAATTPCADLRRGRVCMTDAAFVRPSNHPAAPASLRVSGCADENDLLWGRIDGEPPATVGPRSLRLRCARIRPPTKGCPLVYLKRDQVSVASNPAADDGFSFAFDGDGWRACFLEAEQGPYEVRVFVEDSCGRTTSVRVAGDSAELED